MKKAAVVALHQGVPGQMPWQNTSALAAAMAGKRGNNKIIHQDISNVLADATNDLSLPCNGQRIATTGKQWLRFFSFMLGG